MIYFRCIFCHFFVAYFFNRVSTSPQFQALIPNGNQVPDPCSPGTGQIWNGVGHQASSGGGVPNQFGVDFRSNGLRWTLQLCQMDSDGDGLPNGQELGDPNCQWTPGAIPTITDPSRLSHPGICEPVSSSRCFGRNNFLPASCLLASSIGGSVAVASCPAPFLPSNALMTSIEQGGEYPIGTVLTIQCVPGFVPNQATMTCRADGTWSIPFLICFRLTSTTIRPVAIANQCTTPPVPAGAMVVSQASPNGRYNVDDCIEYSCQPGFNQVGTCLTITCQANGTWTPTEFQCTPAATQCVAPAVPNGARVISQGSPNGRYIADDCIEYSCLPGFNQVGTCLTITCQANGTWTPMEFQCTPATRQCVTPPVPPGAMAITIPAPNGRYNFDECIEYACQSGFSQVGTCLTITCQANGTWTPNEFQCVPIPTTTPAPPKQCTTPPPPEGAISVTEPSPTGRYNIGACIDYECQSNYIEAGTNFRITCQANGTWTPVEFQCISRRRRVQCLLPWIPCNADIAMGRKQYYFENDQVTYACVDGFEYVSGALTVRCQSNATWSGGDLVCRRKISIQCSKPELPRNSLIISNNGAPLAEQYLIASQVQYACQPGFTIWGTIRCQADGSWTSKAMSCQPVSRGIAVSGGTPVGSTGTCQAPRPPMFASQVASATQVAIGEFIAYRCDSGYTSTGILTCLSDGTWSGAVYTCMSGGPGSRALAQPQPTPAAITNNRRLNDLDARFSSLKCTQPMIPQNSQIVSQMVLDNGNSPVPLYPVGAFFMFQCSPGYRIIGEASITCSVDGRWSPSPQCVR